MTSSRRHVLLALAALPLTAQAPAPPALTPQERALADRATAYLEGLAEARADFVQVDARGQMTRGTVFLKRPGRARFAYDPPSGLLVVSDGATVSVADPRLKTFEKYPLTTTPLSLFLAKTIRLDRGVALTRVTRMADGFSITARDGRRQTAGQITLSFTDDPIALAGWTVADAQGRSTQILLKNLQRASGLDPSLFVLKDPRPRAVGRGKL
jgi:outer membrane lipoprotein-sorting protein